MTSTTRRRTGRLTKRLALGLAATAAVAAVPATASAIEVTNVRSGLKADVIWASPANGQGVFLWPNNASLSQEFDKLDSGNGYFRLRAKHSGKCLMLDFNQVQGNGTRIMQWPHCAAGYAGGEWRSGWVLGGNGVQLINRATGKCLDAANGTVNAPPQQAILQIWDCTLTGWEWNSGNQLWNLA